MGWVVDVSFANGVVDWDALKEAGVTAAYIRAGYGIDVGWQDDVKLSRNVSECKRLGIPYGLYLYSYADTEERAKEEALHIVRLAKTYKPSLPVYYDVEESSIIHCVNKNIGIVRQAVEQAGYKFGVYASLSWWNNIITADVPHKWVAHWTSNLGYRKPCDLWQTGTIRVAGRDYDHNVECPNVNKYKVTAKSGLRVRTEPNTSSMAIITLPYDTALEVEEIKNGWAKVSAYVAAEYIKKEG
nr:MAG TPA: hypothetical protein [Caudoviricetes sp.]